MLPDRIQRRITLDDSGCWLWTGTRNTHGYGNVWVDGRMRVAHQVTYEALVGPVPDGLELDHLCQVKACCNPEHLEAVTHAENMRRAPCVVTRRTQETCRRGHAYDEANTYITRKGERCCRACRRRNQTNHLSRKASA